MQSLQGPALTLWKRPVCKGEVPPLQGGEHQTVGQVRHPDLQSAFVSEFEAWFLKTKQASKKWKGPKKLADTAAPHLINLTNPILTKAVLSRVKDMLAQAMGWDKVTCLQLKSMLESCASPEQALRLLLRNSRSHPVTVAKEAAAKQGRQGAGEASDGDDDGDSGPESSTADPDWEQQHSWLALPRDLPVQGVKVGLVPDTDPRVPLRGQRGIWAAQNLPEGFLIGPYRHYALYNRTYATILSTPPRNWTGTPSSWKLQLDVSTGSGKGWFVVGWPPQMHGYAANDDTGEMGTLDSATGKYGLTFSGFGYGNATAYANDPHLNPIEALAKPDMPDDYMGPFIKGPDGQELPGSVQIVFAKICGWAYGFMITHSPVKKGLEVLYDYGHSYWGFAAERIAECARDEELQRKLKDLRAQLRAATENTSGLTTSINPSSSVKPATTQETSGAAAVAAAARKLAAPKNGSAAAAALPAESAGGSCAPAAAAANVEAGAASSSGAPAAAAAAAVAAGTGAAGARAAGSVDAGVSDVRQQMVGMQLARGNGNSRGGDSEMLGASVVQQQHPQQQQPSQQQQQGVERGAVEERTAEAAVGADGAVSAATAGTDGRRSPVEEQDDACSAMPLSVLGNAVVFTPEQQLVLHQRQQRQQEQQRVTKVKDQQGNVQTVRRIDEPDVQQMVSDARMMLSEELLKYPNGIRYSKLKPTWWNRYKAVQECFGDRWCFITSNSECFQLSQDVYSPNTRIELTLEWREALIAQLRAEDRLPMCVLAAEQEAAAGWVQQHYGSNKRRRGGPKEVVRVLRDDAAERELQKQLRDSEGKIAQLRQDVDVLLRLAQAARLSVPQSLLQRHQLQQHHHQQQQHYQQQTPDTRLGAGGDSIRQQQHDRGSSREMQGRGDRQQQSSRHGHGEPGSRNSRSPARDWQAEGYTQHRGSSSGRYGLQSDRTQGRDRSRSPSSSSRGGQRDRSRSAGLGLDSRDRAGDNQRREQWAGYNASTNGYSAPAAAAAPAGGGSSAPLDPSLFDLRSAPVFAGIASDSDTGSRSTSPEPVAPAEPSESEDGEWNGAGVGRSGVSRGHAHHSTGQGSNRQQQGNQQQHQHYHQQQHYQQQQPNYKPPLQPRQGMASGRHDSTYVGRQGVDEGYRGRDDSRQAGRGGDLGYARHPSGAHNRQNASHGHRRR